MTAERSAEGTRSSDSGSAVIGRAFRRSLTSFVIIALLVILALLWGYILFKPIFASATAVEKIKQNEQKKYDDLDAYLKQRYGKR